jgi:hypothetical protein
VIAFAELAAGQDALVQAKRHGLSNDKDIYSVISSEIAHEIISDALQRDLAYGETLLSQTEAEQLARQVFVELFAGCELFYSNGNLGVGGGEWSPATEATFDTGVLGTGPGKVSCIWFLDED